MTILYSCILLSVAAVAYAIHELQVHGKLTWIDAKKPLGFWGELSWQRKYKLVDDHPGLFKQPKDNWYKNLTGLKYAECFPLSSTILVSVTDGAHLMQAVYLLCFSAAIAIHHETWWLWLLIYRSLFGIIFSLVYKLIGR